MEFFAPTPMTEAQAALLARGLFALSRVDGRDEREGLLIRSLWLDAAGGDAPADLRALEASGEPAPAELALGLGSPELKRLFVKTCWLLAYADGAASGPERSWIEATAAALGVEGPEVERLEAQVKDYLLGHLAGLVNTEASAAVAKKMGV